MFDETGMLLKKYIDAQKYISCLFQDKRDRNWSIVLFLSVPLRGQAPWPISYVQRTDLITGLNERCAEDTTTSTIHLAGLTFTLTTSQLLLFIAYS